jgi:hypothetical protein
MVAHDLRFEETPQECELEDRSAIQIREIPKAGRTGLEPLFAHVTYPLPKFTNDHRSILWRFAAEIKLSKVNQRFAENRAV